MGLGFEQRPTGPVGWTAHLAADHPLAERLPLPPGTIAMMVGGGGYVGLVRLPGGSVDVAAAISLAGGRRPGPAVGRIVASVRGWPPAVHADLENWAASVPGAWVTPPLRRRRPPGGGRVLVLGDAAGYVEPMTGEGMTWAMESAELAAELIAT